MKVVYTGIALFAGALLLLVPQVRAEEPAMPVPVVELEWKPVAHDLNFPEGPAWDGRGTLYFSSCNGHFLGKVAPEGYSVLVANDPAKDDWQRTNGLVVGADGFVYACEWGEKKGGILKVSPAGEVAWLTDNFNGERYRRPNDLAFDPQGNLYFTDPNSYDPNKPDGIVFRHDAQTGVVTKVVEGICFSNGLAFTADGRTMMLAESAKHRVLKLAVKADGTLGEPEVFAEMPGGDPDGMNFDIDGNLWVAHFGGGHIQVFSPEGKLIRMVKTPGKKPSNIDFAGPDLKTLYVTEDETNTVYTAPVDVAGLPLFHHPSRTK